MAYAHKPVERRRHFILIGTTNSAHYLTDPTGNRRFWPVKVKQFDVGRIVRDRDQLWAEAAVRETNGESIRLPERLWAAAAKEQEARREVDAWEAQILDVLEHVNPDGESGCKRIHPDLIWEVPGIETARRDARGAARIAAVVHRAGFSSKPYRDAETGKVVRGYVKDVRDGLNFNEGEA